MKTPEEKGEELIEYFLHTHSNKLSDYSRVEYPTAILFAIKVCNEVLSDMGADRGYAYWSGVKEYLKTK